VLDDSTYRDNARHFQKAIAKTNGLSKAADLLEQAFGFANEDKGDKRNGHVAFGTFVGI